MAFLKTDGSTTEWPKEWRTD
ncbi:uncharacterized protein G2W53_028402 [Senna tora]|uniref:Uncharacterized protein n=1 Tax=Senna tora TaxID=362788 RepID=A0A834T0V4_9FABA|nr:uncharacterized protein G2W53_028402 [Senna tora]